MCCLSLDVRANTLTFVDSGRFPELLKGINPATSCPRKWFAQHAGSEGYGLEAEDYFLILPRGIEETSNELLGGRRDTTERLLTWPVICPG